MFVFHTAVETDSGPKQEGAGGCLQVKHLAFTRCSPTIIHRPLPPLTHPLSLHLFTLFFSLPPLPSSSSSLLLHPLPSSSFLFPPFPSSSLLFSPLLLFSSLIFPLFSLAPLLFSLPLHLPLLQLPNLSHPSLLSLHFSSFTSQPSLSPLPFSFSCLQTLSSSRHRHTSSTTSGNESQGGSTRDVSP